MIYLIHETYLGIHTRTIAVCNNEHETVLFLARYKARGKITIDKVTL